jgi:hypothetical protein
MNNVEKAFTLRLYCPRKQVVKQAIAEAFPALLLAPRYLCVKIEQLRRGRTMMQVECALR